jgi:hypothetical protein
MTAKPEAFGKSRVHLLQMPAIVAFCLALGSQSEDSTMAAVLKSATLRAWDQYVRWADQKVHREISNKSVFLIQNTLPDKERANVRRMIEEGRALALPMTGIVPGGKHFSVPGGEIHHWWGTILVPGITLPKLMAFLQDYDHHAGKFSDVERSRLISREGGHFRFFFRLRRTKAFVTAYYNTEQECTYTPFGPGRIFSQSVATKIAELENPGKPEERERPQGNDRGFLWKLVSWWRFEQIDQGVIIELESASLSRDIPALITWIPGISSYIRSTPRESLESVLVSIKAHAGSGP